MTATMRQGTSMPMLPVISTDCQGRVGRGDGGKGEGKGKGKGEGKGKGKGKGRICNFVIKEGSGRCWGHPYRTSCPADALGPTPISRAFSPL